MGWIKEGVGGSAGGGIPSPGPGVLADNEMVKANVGGTELVGTGDTNTGTEVNFGNKTVVAGTGTYKYRNAHSTSSGGETLYTRNLIDGDTFQPCWIQFAEGFATARLPDGPLQNFTQEASKADILVNPNWISNPPVDWIVQFLTFESDTTITNCEFKVVKDGEDFYTAKIGTLPANVETTVNLDLLGSDNVPVNAFAGSSYTVSVTSPDGDVRLKGSTVSGIPFFRVGYYKFIDRVITNQGEVPAQLDSNLKTSIIGKLGHNLDLLGLGDTRLIRDLDSSTLFLRQSGFTATTASQTVVITDVGRPIDHLVDQVRIRNLGEWRNVTITAASSADLVEFTINPQNNLITFADLPRPLFVPAGETWTVTVDGTTGFSGDNATTGLAIQGLDVPPFDPYFGFRSNDAQAKVLDPDLRSQRRTAILGVNRLGYQSSITDGDPTQQGWSDTSTGAASVNVITDPNDGLTTLQFLDDASNGIASIERVLAGGSFQNLHDFGGQLNYVVQAIRQSDNTSIVGGVGFSAANDPGWKGGSRGRFMVTSSVAGNNNQVITPEGGTSHEINVKRDYIEVIIEIAVVGTMISNVYADGVFLEQVDFSGAASNSSWDNKYRFSSGGTSSINREAYLRESLLTEFTSGDTVPLSAQQIEANFSVITPDGVVRDWIVLWPDEDVETFSIILGNLTEFGTVTLRRQDNSTTFNGEEEIRLAGRGAAEVIQVNIDPGAPNRAYQVNTFGDTQIVPITTTQANPIEPPFTPEPKPRLTSIRDDDLSISTTEKVIAFDPMLMVGDIWNDSGTLKFWDGSAWINPTITPKSSSYSTRLTFFQTGTPTADELDLENIWINPSTQVVKEWTGAAWVNTADQVVQNWLAERTLYTHAYAPINGTSRAVGLSITPDGTVLCGEDGFYTGHLSFYVDESSDIDFIVWMEQKPIATGVWELVGTMQRMRHTVDTSGTFNLDGGLDLVSGDEVRIKIKKVGSNSGNLEKRTTSVALGTVVQYPAQLTVWKAARKTP